jgi:selenocysteine lyase/cysteine desulfurase
MTHRRSFIKKSLSVAATFSLPSMTSKAIAEDVSDALLTLNKFRPDHAAQEEDLWTRIAQAYTVSANLLNLNNAGVSPHPLIVQDTVERFYRFSNEAPSHYMWHILDKGREMLRSKLADLAGTSAEQVAINRNATEALATVAYGLTLNKGDEIVMARQDYPNMMQTWKQKEMREGIKINWINFKLPIEDNDAFVHEYIQATTPKTRIWHISHMINWTGQILPVKKLCEEARKRNILSIVDGAQTFGQLDFKISDINPDYFGTSLHKWLCAPFGTGFLYVKRELITSLWPLFSSDHPQSDNIRKFEVLGTRSFPSELAITQAIDFHNAIGSKRKEERLRFLKNYWCEKVRHHPKVKLHVSLQPEFSCAIGNFSVDGIDSIKMVSRLLNEYQIHTVPMIWENVNGVRVSPQIYTGTRDLDRFAEAILEITASV